MKNFPSHRFAGLLTALLIAATLSLPVSPVAGARNLQHQASEIHAVPADGFVIQEQDGAAHCRAATTAEAPLLQPGNAADLRVIYAGRSAAEQQTGLVITLVSTAQLDAAPTAKAAFIRAAQRWENLIQSPLNIIINVDFGTTRFGTPFPSGVIGSTSVQILQLSYPDLRNSLLQAGTGAAKAQLYGLLPPSLLPTDIGNASSALAASSVLRALGVLPPAADPAAEQAQLGSPPSIGFNSALNFDFDPSDGIAAGKLDFEATAAHEIGHALGFNSTVGLKELDASAPIVPAALDFFRFRPGVTNATFTATQRILSSGDPHILFDGAQTLALSTGRPDGSGGDGRQASHWKDDTFTSNYIGIMDPTLTIGVRGEITDNDLTAYDLLGYRLRGRLPELKTDDGSVETGLIADGLLVVNRLTPASYPSTLQKIRVFIAHAVNQPDPSGAQIRLVAFNAANLGNTPPSNVTLLLNQTVTIPVTTANGFVDFFINNGPTINAGDWYVGYQAPTPAAGVAFWLDTSGPQQQRAFSSNNGGLNWQGPLQSSGGTPQPANVLIRAVTFNAAPAPSCTYTIAPTSQNVTANGGPGTVNIATATGCAWFATTNSSFLTINGGASGTGNGAVNFNVAANTSNSPRTGTLTIAGKTFTVTQAGATQQNPVPALTSLSPSAATAGGPSFTLTVNGNNFVNGAAVRWNGNARTTTFVSATQLTAQVLASDIATAGTAQVTVFNPAPGGGVSNALNFTINAAVSNVVTINAASFSTDRRVAPDSLAAAFGTFITQNNRNFSAPAGVLPLPTTLGGVQLRINGVSAGLLFVGLQQINFQVPASLADAASATVTVTNSDGSTRTGTVTVQRAAPGLFSAASNGQGVAIGLTTFDGVNFQPVFNPGPPPSERPVSPGTAQRKNILVLFGTGFKLVGAANITLTLQNFTLRVQFVGAVPGLASLDQINAEIPPEAAGLGSLELQISARIPNDAALQRSNKTTIRMAAAGATPPPLAHTISENQPRGTQGAQGVFRQDQQD